VQGVRTSCFVQGENKEVSLDVHGEMAHDADMRAQNGAVRGKMIMHGE
jgi:hypothetical protein